MSAAEYEVWQARRVVSTRRAPSAREAAYDYVRSLGYPADEITYMSTDSVSWRGAVYRAALAGTLPPSARAA